MKRYTNLDKALADLDKLLGIDRKPAKRPGNIPPERDGAIYIDHMDCYAFGQQGGQLVMWYEAVTASPKTEVVVRIADTGQVRADTFDCSYVGTVQLGGRGHELTLHVYVFGAGLR